MLSEREFNLLNHFSSTPFLKGEDSSSDKEFDSLCELALELHRRGFLSSEATKPYRRNMTGSGPRYLILGAFHLSSGAESAIGYQDYKSYVSDNAQRHWTLGNKIAGLGLLVAVLGLIVTLFSG